MCGSDGARRGSYFGGESVRRAEWGKLRNGKDEVTGEMIKVKVTGWTGFGGCIIWKLRVTL